ncbi:MAG TPA: D-glycero-beta-D-manno-heptose 1-phosphate adenylyltransferase [candidate division Zixibacteria bacterium]|nr:D-glycero-beta-D-manno-heptose 1-phosphate adenylyltransferase [candidate division Zixibacteria bacterium]
MKFSDDARAKITEILRLKAEGAKVVFTNGCFDILHRGHVEYLTTARSFGDVLVVGLNSDESVRRIKGAGRPIVSQSDRMTVLEALRAVDFVIIFEEDTPEKLIDAVAPDVLVKGADWPIKSIVGAEFVLGRGGQVRNIDLVDGRSTTAIIEKIISTVNGGRDVR